MIVNMDFDSLVFPAPQFVNGERVQPYLGWVPHTSFVTLPPMEASCCQPSAPAEIRVPVAQFYLPGRPVLLYLHANAEDICTSLGFVRMIARQLHFGWVIMEYPGYSLYSTFEADKPKHQIIEEDVVRVYDYIVRKGYQVVVLGRSIGTGPALWLATVRTPLGLILLSPFSSLKVLATEKYGWLAHRFLRQRFDNRLRAGSVRCASIVIHGQKDEVVPCHHGQEVYEHLSGSKKLVLVEDMEHSKFDMSSLIIPIRIFLGEVLRYRPLAGDRE